MSDDNSETSALRNKCKELQTENFKLKEDLEKTKQDLELLAANSYPLPNELVEQVISNVEAGGFANSLQNLVDKEKKLKQDLESLENVHNDYVAKKVDEVCDLNQTIAVLREKLANMEKIV